jgi:hypothetical protein
MPHTNNCILLPKVFKRNGILIKFNEILQYNFRTYGQSKLYPDFSSINLSRIRENNFYQELNIDVIDNSKDELQYGTQELILFSKKILALSKEEIDREKAYRRVFGSNSAVANFNGIISPYFLKKYEDLYTLT